VEKGMTHIYSGKGSTLVALGLCVRALGAGLRVSFVRFPESAHLPGDLSSFMNSGDFHYLYLESREKDLILDRVSSEINLGKPDMMILDGILDLASPEGILAAKDLMGIMEGKRCDLELVMTGEVSLPALEDRADVVSDLSEVE